MQPGPPPSGYPPQKGPGHPPQGFDGYGQYPPTQQGQYPPQQGYAPYAPQQQGYGQPWPAQQAAGGYPPQQAPGYGAAPAPAPTAAPGGGAGANGNTIGTGGYVVRVNDPDMDTATAFADTVVRNGFVRKVFGIVGIQLAFTMGIACIFLFYAPLKNYVRTNQWVFWTAWVLVIVLLLVLSCFDKPRRTYPLNMILLAAFTAVQAFLVGTMTAFYSQQAVIIAFAVTSAAVIAISLFAINTKIDVTRWSTMFLVAGIAFIVLLLFGIFWTNKILWLILSGVACLLFSAYLIYDIQLVMGGRYYSISPDEYVFAALSIYLDIINLFMWMLTLIGLAGGNN